jgi:hypothetical protein
VTAAVDIIRAIAGPRIRPTFCFVARSPRAADDWECGRIDVEKCEAVPLCEANAAAAAVVVVLYAAVVESRAEFGTVLVGVLLAIRKSLVVVDDTGGAQV